ncbi:hypothetical protein FJU30_03610 [Affinibrenneria salicis]|uniref:Uncharacterized protein n=1 Tax=Affinibrenneria salicis TaxID=2590031 RepID=A0A5J5G7L9_9GAMM|nr:hypothetical protein [Affinibrenneria salicis]KAA9002635.1 hypothetical protein FJU30_01155 [Affinibrenneria salicis]KAA9003077.1 hypothetical protein FJU30_03610 [Affinibrenneria salicis]
MTINGGSRKENITGDVTTEINSNWHQNIVTSEAKIYSPNKITIKSDTTVFIDSPEFVHNDVKKTNLAQDVLDFASKFVSFSTVSVAVKGGNYAVTAIDVAHKGETFGRSIVNAQRVEAARVESGSVRTALFALYMVI